MKSVAQLSPTHRSSSACFSLICSSSVCFCRLRLSISLSTLLRCPMAYVDDMRQVIMIERCFGRRLDLEVRRGYLELFALNTLGLTFEDL